MEEVDSTVTRRYMIMKKIGKGAYGIIWTAIDRKTAKNVAVKKVFDAFQNAVDARRTFREIFYLQQLNGHDNVINLLSVVRARNDLDIYLVFELVETDVHRVITANVLKDVHRRFIVYQIAKALKYVHSADLLHRDLKPSNILINTECHVKLCDFGLARSVAETDPGSNNVLTDYVATRWYRAPEILLGSTLYEKAIDMWSLGCILWELLQGVPMFPGSSTLNQIELILAVTGDPSPADIIAIQSPFAATMLQQRSAIPHKSIADLLVNTNPDAISLLQGLIQFNPEKRLTAEQVLAHPYLAQFHDLETEPICQNAAVMSFKDNHELTVEQYREKLYQDIIARKRMIRQRNREARARRMELEEQLGIETESPDEDLSTENDDDE